MYRRILQVDRPGRDGRWDPHYVVPLPRGRGAWSAQAISGLRARWEAEGFDTIVTTVWVGEDGRIGDGGER